MGRGNWNWQISNWCLTMHSTGKLIVKHCPAPAFMCGYVEMKSHINRFDKCVQGVVIYSKWYSGLTQWRIECNIMKCLKSFWNLKWGFSVIRRDLNTYLIHIRDVPRAQPCSHLRWMKITLSVQFFVKNIYIVSCVMNERIVGPESSSRVWRVDSMTSLMK